MSCRLLLTTLSALLFVVFTSSSTVSAQQYAGAAFSNSMPGVPGAEITYWNIRDARGNPTSLLNYNNLGRNNRRLNTAGVQKAVIIIHGLQQDPGTYMANMLSALSTATRSNSAINSDTVAIVAPLFANGDQKGVAYPWTTGLSPGAGSTSQALVWQGSQWAGGFNNQYPYRQTTVSSYAVLDQMLQHFDNATAFPNLKSIVVAGHSLGAQAVNRYAAIGRNLGLRTPIRYWIGNPNSYLWFDPSRPVYRDPASVCPTYDNWRDGIGANVPTGYNTELTSAGSAAVLANWRSKSKIYAKGTLDTGDDSSNCNPTTTGQNRDERFFNQITAYPPTSLDNIDYTPVGHDAGAMFQQPAGQARLFFDNFNGDGSQQPDIGDRIQAGDSPNPGSSNAPPPAIKGAGAGGSTYQGCYTDVSTTAAHSLRYTVSVSGSLTVESCTAACSTAGYSIAGMLAGSLCLCDNALAYDSLQVVDRACNSNCPGDAGEDCGGSERISVWSGGKPAQNGAYGNVDTIPGYAYANCYIDNANGVRALAAKRTVTTTMTVGACASLCTGYQYFGLEYANECYCGQTLTAALGASGECGMTCAGSVTELCGGSNRLSVYNATAPVGTTTTTTSTSSTSTATTSTATTSTATTSTATTSTATTSTATTSTATTSTTTSSTPTSTAPTASNTAYKGCYIDGVTRALPTQAYANSQNTIANCRAACSALGYPIAGVEYGSECYCGSQLSSGATVVDNSQCNMPCSGDSSTFCGAGNRLSVFSDLTTLPVATAPQVVPSSGAYSFAGCYSDSSAYRSLPIGHPGGSVERCATACSGSTFFGVEYGAECYCGQALASSATLRPTTECNMACSSNSTQLCGGSNRLSVYQLTGNSGSGTTTVTTSTATTSTTTATTSTETTSTPTTSTETTSTETTSTATTSTSTTSTSTTSTSTTTAPAATNSGYRGCYTDSGSRTLPRQAYAGSSNSIASCRSACSSLGFPIAGAEYGSECWCGSQLGSAATLVADSQCNMPCSGNSSAICGAGNRLSVYSDLATLPVAVAPKVVPSTGSYNFAGCWSDSAASRALPIGQVGGSVEKCASSCTGYPFFGVEYGAECYCGQALASSSSLQTTEQCNMACSSDATQLCGGSNRLSVYHLSGGSSNATTTSTTTTTTTEATSTTPTSTSTATTSTTTASTSTLTSTASSSTTSTSTSTTTSRSPSPTLDSSYTQRGCYRDSGARTLSGSSFSNSSNTPVVCAAYCSSRGYRYSGTEYGSECYCSNYILSSGASSGSGQSGCTIPCAGDSTQTCGGSSRISIVEDTQWVQRLFTVQSRGKWVYSDCVRDTVSPRTLNVTLSGGSSNSVTSCLADCESKNLVYCGMEYSGECYGALQLPTTVTPAANSGSSDPIARGCNMPCSGNSTQACGGPSLLTLYSFDSSRQSTGTVLQTS